MMLLSFEVQKYAKIMTWAKIRATFYGEGMGEMGDMGDMGDMGAAAQQRPTEPSPTLLLPLLLPLLPQMMERP